MQSQPCFILSAVAATLIAFSAVGGYVKATAPIMTEWGERLTPETAWRGYPRPQLVRKDWTNLNGLWQYAITPDGANVTGVPQTWDGEILVPFAVESALSGVGRKLEPKDILWYRRTFKASVRPGERLILNIEQSDYRTQVLVNGVEVGVPHEGGQVAFSYDITGFVREGENELVLSVWDPTGKFIGAVGKQSLKPEGIWYTRTSGVTGTVWLETVPETHLENVRIVPDFEKGCVSVRMDCAGRSRRSEGLVEVLDGGKVIAKGTVADWSEAVVLTLPRPLSPWSPDSPHLYGLRLTVSDPVAGTRDVAQSYFGLRSLTVKKDEVGVLGLYLNGKRCFLNGTLDQGWWPDGLLTPPSDEAMEFDIKMLKRFGFNMMRKHIKVEPRRYYALCDRLGIMVVQDMPSGGGDTLARYGNYRRELQAVIDHLVNVPSIVMWVPYNESWGEPGEFLTHQTLAWVKRHDPSRLVDGPSGWNDYEGGRGPRGRTDHKPAGVPEAADLLDKHDYSTFPHHYELNDRRASFIGEYGGLGYRVADHAWGRGGWGYNGDSSRADPKVMQEKLVILLNHIAGLARKGLVGSVYTQTTDVEDEHNGLVSYDRKVMKFDAAAVAQANANILKSGAEVYVPAERVQLFPRLDPDENAWRFTFDEPAGDWTGFDYDDRAWKRSAGGFGSKVIPRDVNAEARLATEWTGERLWLRRAFAMDELPDSLAEVVFEMFHDEDVDIWLNGEKILSAGGWNGGWEPFTVDARRFRAAARKGRNVLAVSVRQTTGGQYFDAGLFLEFAGGRP